MLTTTNKPMTIRRANDRGMADHGWLKSAHSFSFAGYNDPDNVHYEALRVINDDRVAASGGFPTHPHKNFEIFSYVLEAALEHKDTLGNGSVVHTGGVQYMSTGSGVSHSEFNPSADDAVHFLQIWLIPDTQNVTPRYETLAAADLDKRGKLALILSPDGADGSIRVQQDALVYAANLDGDEQIQYDPKSGRKLWLQMAAGSLTLNGEVLNESDGAALDARSIILEAGQNADFLLFDLAPLQP